MERDAVEVIGAGNWTGLDGAVGEGIVAGLSSYEVHDRGEDRSHFGSTRGNLLKKERK